MDISKEYNVVYQLIVILSIFGILLSFIWGLRNKKKWGYIVAPFFLFVNILMYTTALGFEMLTHSQNELWEGIIILHSLLFAILMVIVMPPLNSLILIKHNNKGEEKNEPT